MPMVHVMLTFRDSGATLDALPGASASVFVGYARWPLSKRKRASHALIHMLQIAQFDAVAVVAQ